MKEQLRQAEQLAPPDQTTYERILHSVLDEAGAEQKVSYASAKIRVSQAAKTKTSRSGFVACMGGLAAAACLALIAMPMFRNNQGAYDDTLVMIEDGDVPLADFPDIGGGLRITLGSIDVEQQTLTIHVEGDLGNVNWASVWLIDEAGERTYPLSLDEAAGIAVFAYADGDLTLHLNDLDDNMVFWLVEE